MSLEKVMVSNDRITNCFASQNIFSSLLSTKLVVDLIELSANEGTVFDLWYITEKEVKELINMPIRKLAFLFVE